MRHKGIITMPSSDMIVWERLDLPGHEFAEVCVGAQSHTLTGTAIFVAEGKNCLISYKIFCDAAWETQEVHVTGVAKDERIEIALAVSQGKAWTLNGVEQPQVEGCVDIDLAFTPATNLLPIRRCKIAVGQSEHVVAAWLKFPELTIEKLPQTYTRISESQFHYSSGDGEFETDLTVKTSGLVSNYPALWREERVT
jgi:uncharacterized protein